MIRFTKTIFLFSLLCSCLLVAGDISGVVHFKSAPAPAPTADRYGIAMSAMQQMPATHDIRAVVYIADEFPDSVFVPPAKHPVMDQRNQQFVPYLLPVLVGTTVDFPNNDKVYHNVFSFSKTKTFDLGKYPTKTFKQVLFDKTGVVTLYCEIHAHMNAFILVLPNPYFTTVKKDGRFRIENVPPGRYSLKVFFGRSGELQQSVQTPAQGDVQVEFFQ